MMHDVSIADCERVETAWLVARANTSGGAVWRDTGLTWSTGPDGLSLLFPRTIDPDALNRGLERARAASIRIVGAWLSADVDASPLTAAGFSRGWSPWWMTAPTSMLGRPGARRVELQQYSDDYHDADAGYADLLALTREHPTRAWYAAAYTTGTHRFAGRSWSFLDGHLAGIFDTEVWSRYRRQGFGSDLVRTVTAAAARAGARHMVLNATPEGTLLYEKLGFTSIGEGTTWWLRLPAGRG